MNRSPGDETRPARDQDEFDEPAWLDPETAPLAVYRDRDLPFAPLEVQRERGVLPRPTRTENHAPSARSSEAVAPTPEAPRPPSDAGLTTASEPVQGNPERPAVGDAGAGRTRAVEPAPTVVPERHAMTAPRMAAHPVAAPPTAAHPMAAAPTAAPAMAAPAMAAPAMAGPPPPDDTERKRWPTARFTVVFAVLVAALVVVAAIVVVSAGGPPGPHPGLRPDSPSGERFHAPGPGRPGPGPGERRG